MYMMDKVKQLAVHVPFQRTFVGVGWPRERRLGVSKLVYANFYRRPGRDPELRGMLSANLSPFHRGSPLLFQTGKLSGPTADRSAASHDFIMGYLNTIPLSSERDFTYFGYPGEPPDIGPCIAHRLKICATLSSPRDSTIAFGVLTTGFTYR